MLGVVLLLRDVTRLKELDRLKSEFVMTASHELRTPLQSLGMSIDLLQEERPTGSPTRSGSSWTPPTRRSSGSRSLVTRPAGPVEDRGRQGRRWSSAPVPVRRARGAGRVAVFRPQAEKQRVELTGAVPEGLPDVRADANKITWVLTNLISNALRYVGAGGHIRVSAERVGEWVHLSVADDGEGIPEEYQSRIFDKFVQVKSAEAVGGTGLGLAICREIVRAHKGTIWVESTPGKGSIFTFTLPVAHQS